MALSLGLKKRWDVKRIRTMGCKTSVRHWRHMSSRFAVDRRASTALEFGLVITPLAALMVAIIQVGAVFFAQQTLETTAEKSVRQLLTGKAQTANNGAGMTASDFKTLVCSKLPSFMKCSNVIVDVQTVSNFSNATTSRPTLTYDANGNITNNWQYAPGGPDSINVARIMYIWNTQQGPLGFDLSTMSNQQRLLVATQVFKAEHYQ